MNNYPTQAGISTGVPILYGSILKMQSFDAAPYARVRSISTTSLIESTDTTTVSPLFFLRLSFYLCVFGCYITLRDMANKRLLVRLGLQKYYREYL